jgi:hypothetical protein
MVQDEALTHVAVPLTLKGHEVPSHVHLMREQVEWSAVMKRVVCNYHTTWNRVPLENIAVSQSRNFLTFKESEGLLPVSKYTASGPCDEPQESSSLIPALFI